MPADALSDVECWSSALPLSVASKQLRAPTQGPFILCRDCQYIGAGSGTVNVFFPSEAVKVEGVLSDYTSAAASGNLMHRQFCPTCGTPVSHL